MLKNAKILKKCSEATITELSKHPHRIPNKCPHVMFRECSRNTRRRLRNVENVHKCSMVLKIIIKCSKIVLRIFSNTQRIVRNDQTNQQILRGCSAHSHKYPQRVYKSLKQILTECQKITINLR